MEKKIPPALRVVAIVVVVLIGIAATAKFVVNQQAVQREKSEAKDSSPIRAWANARQPTK